MTILNFLKSPLLKLRYSYFLLPNQIQRWKVELPTKFHFPTKIHQKGVKFWQNLYFSYKNQTIRGEIQKKLIFLKILDFLWGAFTPPLDTHLFMIKFPISYKINLYFWPETSKIIAILEMSTLKILLFYECS